MRPTSFSPSFDNQVISASRAYDRKIGKSIMRDGKFFLEEYTSAPEDQHEGILLSALRSALEQGHDIYEPMDAITMGRSLMVICNDNGVTISRVSKSLQKKVNAIVMNKGLKLKKSQVEQALHQMDTNDEISEEQAEQVLTKTISDIAEKQETSGFAGDTIDDAMLMEVLTQNIAEANMYKDADAAILKQKMDAIGKRFPEDDVKGAGYPEFAATYDQDSEEIFPPDADGEAFLYGAGLDQGETLASVSEGGVVGYPGDGENFSGFMKYSKKQKRHTQPAGKPAYPQNPKGKPDGKNPKGPEGKPFIGEVKPGAGYLPGPKKGAGKPAVVGNNKGRSGGHTAANIRKA